MPFAVGFADGDILCETEAECLSKEWVEGEVEAGVSRTVCIDGLLCD